MATISDTTSPGSPGPRELKSAAREQWSAVADAWRKWWPIFEAGAQALNERLVDLAEIRTGHRALDVATGIGEPALTAAQRVGPRGSVVATDFALPMLALGRERARERGLTNVEFVGMDAEDVALVPERFDAATCRWGLMLMPDPRAACERIRRLLKPGARLAAAVWGMAEQVPFIAIPLQVAQREANLPAPAPGTPGALTLGRPGALEDVLAGAGFRDLRSETMQVTFTYASPEEYARFLGDVSSSLRHALADQPDDMRERVWAGILREAGRRAATEGRVRLENEVRCVSGAR